ncbi:hypothetical protein [Kaistella palustris]|uniref:hypothetical protein n=1 Tax=Kaistella palustris TaxID=493376 RepID=UPI00041D7F85|nr:hypothetical protein [Kaistella palustris]
MSTENKSEKTSFAVTVTAIATLITALGGLIYALKSKDASDAERKEPSSLSIKGITGTEKIFHGNVGKLQTTFNLTFDNNSTGVSGNYYYNKRQDQLYDLKGIYTGEDLHLTEFTKGTATAKCVLQKSGNDCFTGKMFNNDGRSFVMNICENGGVKW